MTALALSCQDGKIISGQEEHSRTERSLQDRKITPSWAAAASEACVSEASTRNIAERLNLKRGLKKTSPQCIIYLEVIKETVIRLMMSLQISSVIFSYIAIL